VLKFPLSTVPLSISFPDGIKRSTTKSKLVEILGVQNEIAILPKVDSYVVDATALIRIQSVLPKTYIEFIHAMITSLPRGNKEVHLVYDSYLPASIKSSERDIRGSSAEVIVKSIHSLMPRDFNLFMKNGENKNQLASGFIH